MAARLTRPLVIVLLALAILWVALPIVRAAQLLWVSPFRTAPARPLDLAVQDVQFTAADGVVLRGWLVRTRATAPTIVLVSYYQGDRTPMVPYARFLHAAGFNVLLYDSRGTGASEGSFSLGLREVSDAQGALAFLRGRRDLPNHHYGLLGLSLGAGVAIVAAAHTPSVLATVADSAYVDQSTLVRLRDTPSFGPLHIPLLPLAPWAVDLFLGTRLASFSPLRAAGTIAPRALLLIHSLHDANPTTPLGGALALYRAARPPVALWIAPRGGHAGALAAQPGAYISRVVAFFRRYLLSAGGHPVAHPSTGRKQRAS